MADTGGSAATERDQFGLLPSSDIRKSLVGLAEAGSEEKNILRDLFQYRYSGNNGVSGMTFGNLFLVALSKILGSQIKAIEKAGEILRIRGRVLPVTLQKVDLQATFSNGSVVTGEHAIDEPKHNGTLQIIDFKTNPKAQVYQPVADAISAADMIVLGPGGLYTTVIANLVIDGVAAAIAKSKAKVVYIMNLMTEYGQTYNMKASDHVAEIEKYIGRCLDYVLINNAPPPVAIIKKYQAHHAIPVVNDLKTIEHGYKEVARDLLYPYEVKKAKSDRLKRSLIRHDPEKIAQALINLL